MNKARFGVGVAAVAVVVDVTHLFFPNEIGWNIEFPTQSLTVLSRVQKYSRTWHFYTVFLSLISNKVRHLNPTIADINITKNVAA